MFKSGFPNMGAAVLVVFFVWVIYLLVEVAKHVHAWPF